MNEFFIAFGLQKKKSPKKIIADRGSFRFLNNNNNNNHLSNVFFKNLIILHVCTNSPLYKYICKFRLNTTLSN